MSYAVRPGPKGPNTPELVRHNMRIPKELRAVLEDLSDARGVSLAAATRSALEAGVEALIPGALQNLQGNRDAVP